MGLFRHHHRYDQHEYISRGPVQVANIDTCRCGDKQYFITAAGWQQIDFGADIDYERFIAGEKWPPYCTPGFS